MVEKFGDVSQFYPHIPRNCAKCYACLLPICVDRYFNLKITSCDVVFKAQTAVDIVEKTAMAFQAPRLDAVARVAEGLCAMGQGLTVEIDAARARPGFRQRPCRRAGRVVERIVNADSVHTERAFLP